MSTLRTQFIQSPIGRWYYGRERNEQVIILGLAVLVIIAVLWVGVWKPVSDWRAVAVKRQNNAQQLYDWLRANETRAKQAARTSPTRATGAITPIITRAAAAHQITVNRLQPESNGVVSVVLQQQAFNKIIAWVAQLEENNGVNVQRASIDGVDAPGYVNAQLRLN